MTDSKLPLSSHQEESSPLLASSLLTSQHASSPFSLEIEPAPLSPTSPALNPSATHGKYSSSAGGRMLAAMKARMWQSKLLRNQTTMTLVIAFLVILLLLLLVFFSFGTRSQSNSSPGQAPVPTLPDQDLAYFLNGLGYQDDWQGRLTILPASANVNAARAEWVLGMQLYHSMWYPLSGVHFKRARTIAPLFPMAYWGEALSYKQPLWGTEDIESASLVLNQLAIVYSRVLRSVVDPSSGAVISKVTDEEASYLSQVFAYFNSSQSMQQRQIIQLESMARIYSANSNSSDACSLYGLSILASSYMQELVNSSSSLSRIVTPTVESSRSIMEQCLPAWPNHTGLLHYLVHTYDVSNVTVAQKGFPFGYKLAQVAPLSAHTTHMVTHLSVRMGNWSEVIAFNNMSLTVGDAYCSRPSQEDGEGDYCSFDNRYHSLDWLAFGFAQTCQFSSLPPLLSRAQQVAISLKYPYYSTWAYKIYSYSAILSNLWFSPTSLSILAPGNSYGGRIGVWPDSNSPGFLTSHDSMDAAGPLPSPLPPQIISASSPDPDDYYLAVGECFALIALAFKQSMSLSPSIMKAISQPEALSASSPLFLSDAQRVHGELTAISARLQEIQTAINLRNTSSYLSVYTRQLIIVVDAMKSFHNDCLHVLPLAGRNVSGLFTHCINSSRAGGGGWVDWMNKAVGLDPLLDPDDAPSLIPIHADELYGQMLLLVQSTDPSAMLSNAAKAKSLFSLCLSVYPNRLPCVLGLARSYVALSDSQNAKIMYSKILSQCPQGDSSWPGLSEVRSYLSS
jgi:hypothetical protein